MPKIIKNGAVIDDTHSGQVCTLDQWLALSDKKGSAVILEPGEAPAPLLPHLNEIELIAINFPAFADGRGFSYGRELRERGYAGEIRATGQFLRDQLTYLSRCGFDAFQMANESALEDALSSLEDFSEHYQAAIDKPQPLFRRRDNAAS